VGIDRDGKGWDARLSFLKRKTKEEVELARRARIREARNRLQRYVESCERVLGSYERNAVEAMRLENKALARRFAAKMVLLDKQIRRAKTLQLMLSDIELSREQAGLFRNLADSVKDFVKDLADEETMARMAAELERDLSTALLKSERLDLMLGDVIDSMNEKILSVGEVDVKEIERVLGSIEEGAVRAERESLAVPESQPREKELQDELDRRIEEGLRKVREAGKK